MCGWPGCPHVHLPYTTKPQVTLHKRGATRTCFILEKNITFCVSFGQLKLICPRPTFRPCCAFYFGPYLVMPPAAYNLEFPGCWGNRAGEHKGAIYFSSLPSQAAEPEPYPEIPQLWNMRGNSRIQLKNGHLAGPVFLFFLLVFFSFFSLPGKLTRLLSHLAPSVLEVNPSAMGQHPVTSCILDVSYSGDGRSTLSCRFRRMLLI